KLALPYYQIHHFGPSTVLSFHDIDSTRHELLLPFYQGWTDNSWGPQAIGDHGAPVSLPKLKKAYEKGTRGISWGPLLTRVSKWSVRPCFLSNRTSLPI
ncbi:unnamed protein product, partial [Staurois parvus]